MKLQIIELLVNIPFENLYHAQHYKSLHNNLKNLSKLQ